MAAAGGFNTTAPRSLTPTWLGLRAMFYLVGPQESTFEHARDVPDYVTQAIPFFQAMVVLEIVILWLKGQKVTRINDGISSVSAGVISQLTHLFFRGIHAVAYIECYNRFNIYTLPWNSVYTWIFMFLGVDLCYYFFHRLGHEINFMWAAHQTHHSSEEYNLTTALRQSIFQPFSSFVFYLPLSLLVSPPMFLVHSQFNLLYQFWIHTQLVGKLGPLEYILNTPSHHRVHHGRNRYCIDKNYAGTLIIWDRLFGTFAEEDDEVVYGLVHPLNSWNPFYAQLNHWLHILQTSFNTKGLWNKVCVFIYGPGWEPGKPRLGNMEDIPDIHAPQESYNPKVSAWRTVYTGIQVLMILNMYSVLQSRMMGFSQSTTLLCVVFLLWGLYNVAALGENKSAAPPLELLRCLSLLVLVHHIQQEYTVNEWVANFLYAFYGISAMYLVTLCVPSSKPSFKQE